jgi:putative phosphoribosyl transferase
MNRVTDFLSSSTRRPYSDRAQAGRQLAEALCSHPEVAGTDDAVVLGLARGGVPVAAEVAAALGAALDVVVVRKIGAPGHEELALGAIAGKLMVLNQSLIRSLGIAQSVVDEVIARERDELARRVTAYRSGREEVALAGRTAILVDDGIATGASMHVAALEVRAKGAAKVIVAVPTAPPQAASELAGVADVFVCPHTPKNFVAVGMSYADFAQVDDDEVRAALNRRRD